MIHHNDNSSNPPTPALAKAGAPPVEPAFLVFCQPYSGPFGDTKAAWPSPTLRQPWHQL